MAEILLLARIHESAPLSRFWFGSPCKYVRTIDLVVHVLFPRLIADRFPLLATYLRTTSPRWGRTWRHW
jgi:hypothetical protein